MQWEFRLGSGSDVDQRVVEVPDGAYPPEVGEAVRLDKGLVGEFRVTSRVFQARMPEGKAIGPLTWGWSFVLE